jgi:CheY-like chemotaxis protein
LSVALGKLPNGAAGVVLRVRDNGMGMRADLIDNLFQPFTQADASTSRRFGGTGLGLSISGRLVSLMDGVITVSSELGVGSEFSVMLPLHEAPVEQLPKEAAVPPLATLALAAHSLATGPMVLLAEDNETNRDVLQEQLRLLGYAAEVVEDGVQALEKWRTGRFDLLLTDCHMPNMNGFELTAAIRAAEPPGTHLTIIAVTANAMQGEAQRCLVSGMDDYLSKPVRLTELGQKLGKWLGSTTAPAIPPAQKAG